MSDLLDPSASPRLSGPRTARRWAALVLWCGLGTAGLGFVALVWITLMRLGLKVSVADAPGGETTPAAVAGPPLASPTMVPPLAAEPSGAQVRSAIQDGPVVASSVVVGADDFVVDVHHNGRQVPDAARRMTAEVHGATGERIDVTLRAGDWLVFNVVNNRLRWNGVCYFAAAGLAEDGALAFVSEENEQWSVCEDPGLVPSFIAHRDFLANRRVQAIPNPWAGGTKMMVSQVRGWSGQPIWGSPTNRNIWLKLRLPRSK